MFRSLLAILLLGLALTACSSSPEQGVTEQRDQSPSYSAPDASTMIPIALRIPAIKLDAHDDWVPLGIQGENGIPVTPPGKKGQIEIPPLAKVNELGWFCPTKLPHCGAPIPGTVGPAVVVGHVNGNGRDGVFAHLARVKVGDLIEIDRQDGVTITFKSTKVSVVKKTAFPTDEVYGDQPTPQLRLITCGGGDNSLVTTSAGRSYVNNTVVFAEELSQRPTHQ
jgi:LPXTG-site transpeptidase (sortase) family protein